MSKSEKLGYLQTAPIGTLVAFVVNPKIGIYLSGKIQERNNESEILKVVTRKGSEYIVRYENVLWVRTGERWPRAVFELLFGGSKDEEKRQSNVRTRNS